MRIPICVLCFTCFQTYVHATPGKLDRVVASVNGTPILASDLDLRTTAGLKRAEVLEEMIDEELEVQASTAAKLDVSEHEIDAAIAEIEKANHLDDAGLAHALDAQGYTLPHYRAELRRQLLRLRGIQALAPHHDAVAWTAKLRKQAVIERR